MSTPNVKEVVREKYGQAALRVTSGAGNPCCRDDPSTLEGSCDPITSNLYDAAQEGEVPDTAIKASLGCGNPTVLAELKPGEIVLDLGSGGGIDVLLSARRVGPTGKAYGLDMTDEMLALAEENKRKSGFTNVEFLKGEIENIPLPDNSVDVIISNCVINLSGDKDRVLKEAFRVLKPGGRFGVSDVVVRGKIPDQLFALIATGRLYADPTEALLIEPQRVRLFCDRESAAAFLVATSPLSVPSMNPVSPIVVEVGACLEWDGLKVRIVHVGRTAITLQGEDDKPVEISHANWDALLKKGGVRPVRSEIGAEEERRGASRMETAASHRIAQANVRQLVHANRRAMAIQPRLWEHSATGSTRMEHGKQGMASGKGEEAVSSRTERYWRAKYRDADQVYGYGYRCRPPDIAPWYRPDRQFSPAWQSRGQAAR